MPQDNAQHDKQILLIEDSEVDYQTLLRALEKTGGKHPVLWFQTADAAMAHFEDICAGQAAAPALVVLDLNLPGMHGLDFLKAVKDNAELKTIPVVVMSTSNADSDIHASYQNGANGYIRKPANTNELYEVVEILNKYWFGAITLPVNLAKHD